MHMSEMSTCICWNYSFKLYCKRCTTAEDLFFTKTSFLIVSTSLLYIFPCCLQTSTSETFASVKSGANDVACCPGTQITKSQSHSPQTTANAGTTLGLSSFHFQIKQSWWVFFGRSGHCLSILCLLSFSFNMCHLQFRLFEITNGFLCFFNVHLLSLILGFKDWNLLHLLRLLHLFSLYILRFCHCRLCALNCRFFGFGCRIDSWNRLRRLGCFGTWATHGASVQRCRRSWLKLLLICFEPLSGRHIIIICVCVSNLHHAVLGRGCSLFWA